MLQALSDPYCYKSTCLCVCRQLWC